VVAAPRPAASVALTVCASVSFTSLPSAGPVPEGVKTSVWALLRFQWPGSAGDSFGSRSPSTLLTGSESVRRS
jgi:hypothetical protein